MNTSTTPAGWHPDPSGRHEWRHWDGQRWTDHVSDGGVTTLDPLPPAPVPAQGQPAESVVLDTQVKAGLKGGRRLVITDRALYDGDQTFAFAAVTGMNHCRTKMTMNHNSRALNYSYDILLAMAGEKKPRRIYWTGLGDHEQQVFDAVVDALHRFVAPRLLADLVKRIAAGETIEVYGLLISAAGVARKKLIGGGAGPVVPWSPALQVVPEDGFWGVINDGPRVQRVAAVPMKELNAALLPPLIRAFTG
jgi:hypothetical protein